MSGIKQRVPFLSQKVQKKNTWLNSKVIQKRETFFFNLRVKNGENSGIRGLPGPSEDLLIKKET